MDFIKNHRLGGSGIGWVDAHILASALESGSHIFTLDSRLKIQADNLDCLYIPAHE
jgi:hypothetical protein